MEIGGPSISAGIPLRPPGEEVTPSPVFPTQAVERQPGRNTRPVEPGKESNRARKGKDEESERGLGGDERREVEQLRAQDRHVRSSEATRLANAGPHARGSAVFETEIGPDGRRYAVSGDVVIDTKEIPGNPEATARKMAQIRRAILASGDLTPKDRAVAAEATRKLVDARLEAARDSQDAPASLAEGEKTEIEQLVEERFLGGGQGDAPAEPGEFLDLIA